MLYKPPKLTRARSCTKANIHDMDLAGTVALISTMVCLLLALPIARDRVSLGRCADMGIPNRV